MRALNSWPSLLLLIAGLALSTTSNAAFTRVEENHPSITYEGDWRTVSRSGVSGGSAKAANAAGARVSVFFRGTSISWIGYRCYCAAGTARVYVDGDLKVTSQQTPSSSTPEAQSTIYTVGNLGSGAHVLTIELTGQSTGLGDANAFVAIDAFDIENGAPMRHLQENDSAVTYTGTWMDIDDPSVSGGSVLATQEAGATATLRFSGNTVQWVGYRCPCTGGLAEVSIDEQSFGGTHTNYSPTTRQAQVLTFGYFALADGEHEMTVRVTGENMGDSKWVVVDAFQVDATGSDITAPEVIMTAPGNDEALTGVVTLEAEASDDVGVTKVQFMYQPSFQSGDYILLGEDTQPPYELTRDTSHIVNGSQFRLKVRAWDAENNYAEAPVVNVRINHTDDPVPPVVTITEPTGGSTVSGTINLTATATDNKEVRSVRFFFDSLGTDYIMTTPIVSPPYTMPFDTRRLKDGLHEVTATAVDVAANVGTAAINFTVDNSVQPGMVRVDDDDPAIAFSGTWALDDDGGLPRFHWDSAAWSQTVGASATFTFEGVGVRWLGYACEHCGVASVSIDGGAPQQVDLYDPDQPGEGVQLGSAVYASPALASGTHTLTITVQGPIHGTSADVYVDGFEVLK